MRRSIVEIFFLLVNLVHLSNNNNNNNNNLVQMQVSIKQWNSTLW